MILRVNFMCEELVSIITPVYNAEDHIKTTVYSVINQTYKNWEMLLINDCSTDNSERIILDLVKKDQRLRYLKLEKNSGVAIARNKGIENAKGKYIAFLDADDVWLPNKLSTQIDFMKKYDVSFSFTSYELIDMYGKKLNKIINVPKEISYEELLKGNIIGCFTVIYDKDRIGTINMPSVKHEDYVTWLSILKKGHRAYGINEILGYYRKTTTSLTRNKLKSAIWTWNIYRKSEKLSLAKSTYYFANYIIKGIIKHWL
nr:glycosyltransferase family 2 protein [Geobacillus kaustophilus]